MIVPDYLATPVTSAAFPGLAAVQHAREELRGLYFRLAKATAYLVVPGVVLRGASVLVLPSVQDGFGLVVLEAMAAGLPVIVSDHVGAKDCVREGVDGFVVPVRDADAIAERLRWLRADRSRQRRMGLNAREQALRYTWDAYRQRLLAKIESLASTGGVRSPMGRAGVA